MYEKSSSDTITLSVFATRYLVPGIALDEMHSSAVLSLLVFCFVTSQLELVRVWRETSRHQHRRQPSTGAVWLRLNVCYFSLENQEQKARASRSRASFVKYDYYYYGGP